MDQSKPIDIIRQANMLADKASLVADDFAQVLFPHTEVVFSDRMRSNARQYLRNIVSQIEREICRIATTELGVTQNSLVAIAEGGKGQSYSLLADSGLFNSPEIVGHLFVRAQLEELAARMLQKISQEDLETTLTRYLNHQDSAVAEAAMEQLVAQSKANGTNAVSLADMTAEIAYAFAWPVTAALARISNLPSQILQQATRKLLAAHDEAAGVGRKSERLAQLLEQSDSEVDQTPHPMQDGLSLFIARLARQSGLSREQIITFTAEPDMARLVVTMRAVGIPSEEALSIFAALDGGDHILTAATYGETDYDRALALVNSWASPAAFQQAGRTLARDLLGDPEK